MFIQKWKKMLSFALALFLMAGLSPPGRAADTKLRVTMPEEIPRAGETFTVTVDLSGNPGLTAVQLTLDYNRAALECVKAEPGELLEGALAASNPAAPTGAVVAAVSLKELQGDGRLAVFTFTAKQNLTSYPLYFSETSLLDAKGADVSHTVTGPPASHLAVPGSGEPPNTSSGGTPDETGGGTSLFTDTAGHPYEADIVRAARLGVMQGFSDGSFRPDAPLTRAQFVTILHRLAGRPAAGASPPFQDTAGLSGEFRQAIAWAYGEGYVSGTSPAAFHPGGTLSRQAAMKILFQYAGGTAGAEQMFYSVYDQAFPDSGQLAEWARAPVYWGVYHSLIAGEAGEQLSPAAPATRGQLARIMVRYLDKFGGGFGT